jgi:membrane protease YdiL (CAAX protease family)
LILFASGEAFWRGYIIFGLRPAFGLYAIPIMIIPYSMSHFGKPFPEAMGSIVAGGVLGYLALRHGNFWLGVLAHYAVALIMDLTAIFYRGISLV